MRSSFMIDQSPTSSDLALRMMALETLSAQDALPLFRQTLPQLSDKIKKASTALVELPLTLFLDKQQMVVRHLSSFSYADISGSLVVVPENFNGQFLPFLQTMTEMQDKVYAQAFSCLEHYHVLLSSFLTNKETQIASKDDTSFYLHLEKSRQEEIKKLDFFFHAPNPMGRRTFGSVVARIADLPEIFSLSKKLEKQNMTSNLKAFEVQIKKISDMIDMIIKRSEENDINKISPAAARNLSQGAYEVARYIEFVTVFQFKVDAAVKAINELTGLLYVNISD